MIPTLIGRLQTRVFLIVFVGVPWTLIVTPFLPNRRGEAGGSVLDTYGTTLSVLAIVLVLALCFWEWLYHFLQQLRWEKDWPSLFSLVLVVPEAILAKIVFDALDLGERFDATATDATFWWHITTTWLVMWLFAQSGMRILFPRWRFRGGRVFF